MYDMSRELMVQRDYFERISRAERNSYFIAALERNRSLLALLLFVGGNWLIALGQRMTSSYHQRSSDIRRSVTSTAFELAERHPE